VFFKFVFLSTVTTLYSDSAAANNFTCSGLLIYRLHLKISDVFV
ncbi:MAG: hypothetical protein ACI8RD_003923, partial [Bacillariaceae sp.]